MLKLAKNQTKAKQHVEVKLLLFENCVLFPFTLSSKDNRRYSKKFAKYIYVYLNQVIMINGNENQAGNEK